MLLERIEEMLHRSFDERCILELKSIAFETAERIKGVVDQDIATLIGELE